MGAGKWKNGEPLREQEIHHSRPCARGPTPPPRRPWIRNIPTWSDAEPAVAADIAVVLHHSTDDRGANQGAAGERQARYRQAGDRCYL